MRRILILSAVTLLMWGCSKSDDQTTNNDEDTSKTPKELEALDWLTGSWEDDEAGMDVNFSWKWDLNHRFLVQEFTVIDETESTLTGTQILGWDPIEKSIRSWTFDSDGGFGTSRWENDQENWYVQTSYTTPASEKASATYVYKKVDDNTFTFSSEIREVDGAILPDVGPYKFVRN